MKSAGPAGAEETSGHTGGTLEICLNVIEDATRVRRDGNISVGETILAETEDVRDVENIECFADKRQAQTLAEVHVLCQPEIKRAEGAVEEDYGKIVGTYCWQPNQKGGLAHVADCVCMTSVSATGRGMARAMCVHSLDRARELEFRAMQFNFVISTNERAVKLWQSFEFAIVGRLTKAFLHPTQGHVDAFIMYRDL